MKRALWEWLAKRVPVLLVWYYTAAGRTGSKQMRRVLSDMEKKKACKKTGYFPAKAKPDGPVDDGIALRQAVDIGIQEIKNADLLIGGNNIVIFGNPQQNLYPVLEKINAGPNKFNCIWILNFKKIKSIRTTFCTPEKLTLGAQNQWINQRCFSLTEEEKYRAENEEALKMSFETIMSAFPQMDEDYIKLVVHEIERYYSAVYDAYKPKLAIIFNQFSYANRITLDLAKKRKIPFLFAENGNLPGTLNFDTVGELGESLPARNPEWFSGLNVNERELEKAGEIIKYLKSSNMNRKRQPLTLPEDIHKRLNRENPVVLYAGIYDLGSGILPYNGHAKKYHSPIFASSRDAMLYLARLAGQNNWNLIYKPHPIAHNWNLEDAADIPDNVVYAPVADINQIIDMADVVVTILSTTAYIALIRDKPVVMTGYIHLRGQGCTYEAFEPDNIEPAILDAIKYGYTKEQKAAFTEHIAKMCKYYLFDEYRQREISYGRPAKEAAEYIESVLKGGAEF